MQEGPNRLFLKNYRTEDSRPKFFANTAYGKRFLSSTLGDLARKFASEADRLTDIQTPDRLVKASGNIKSALVVG